MTSSNACRGRSKARDERLQPLALGRGGRRTVEAARELGAPERHGLAPSRHRSRPSSSSSTASSTARQKSQTATIACRCSAGQDEKRVVEAGLSRHYSRAGVQRAARQSSTGTSAAPSAGRCSNSVEPAVFDALEDPHASQPGEPQLGAQAAAHAVADRAALAEQLARDRDAALERARPRVADRTAREVGFVRAGRDADLARDVQPARRASRVRSPARSWSAAARCRARPTIDRAPSSR